MDAIEHGHLRDALVLLLAAIIAVSLLQRLRLSPVLAYLVAGIAVGPYGTGLVREAEAAQALAEFGVIFLLFTIGLDLPMRRLQAIWRYIFGLGLAQVALTWLLVGGVAYLLGVAPEASFVIGGALAFSSTATVLQLLRERGELAGRFGRVSIAVLLFQDLAVVPLLALLPLLQREGLELAAALGLALVKAVLALAIILLAGRLVLRPLYRLVAGTRNEEIFAATNLLVVLGTGWATAQAGMSMALGAFLAGLLLAETEFRHQVEADIRPFRGLFLGLFFITVGMVIDLRIVAANAPAILALTAALLVGKAAILGGLCLLAGLRLPLSVRAAFTLAQGGEFAFVVFSLATQLGLLPASIGLPLIAVVALGMAATPLLAHAGRLIAAALEGTPPPETERLAEEADELSNHVIIAGYGRIGHIVGRLLQARGTPYVAIDLDPACVAAGRQRGAPVFFGDASRADVLRAAGLARAAGAVITLDRPEAAERIVEALRRDHPGLRIIARSRDPEHGRRLEQAGAGAVVMEALEPGLQIAAAALRLGGVGAEEIERLLDDFRRESAATAQRT